MPYVFKDYFSEHSKEYAKYRPSYPDDLTEYILKHVREHELAWDCATGNGQVALALAGHFKKIIATDASREQLDKATENPSILYLEAAAETSVLEPSSVDLVTVATALHWFRFEPFFNEVNRVLKPDGFFAAWGYGLVHISDDIDNCIHNFYQHIVGPYWPAERIYMDQHYETVPFPFPLLETPSFTMSHTWTLERLMGYIQTWSACENYRKTHGKSPLPYLESCIAPLWKGETMSITWPIFLKCGYPNNV